MTLKEEIETESKSEKKAREAREKRVREAYERVLARYELLKKHDGPEERDEAGKIKKQKNIHWYFNSIIDFKDCSYNGNILNIIIFYVCMRIERAHRKILYCDMIKRHKINKKITDKYLDNLRLYGDRFFIVYEELVQKPYKGITQTAISAETIALIESTKKMRNKVIHGDEIMAISKRKEKTICTLLDYAERLNEEISHISRIRPFGDLTGFGGSDTTNAKSRDILAKLKIKINEKLYPNKNKPKCLKKCLQK